MKKFWIALVSALMVAVSVFSVVGCKTTDDGPVLDNYVLKESGSLVDADFVLPSKVSEKDVTWTSDNAAIAVEQRTEDWLAKVTLGDEATPVTLTVACGDETKSFGVTVAALDVAYFAKNYKFDHDLATVYEDFALPTSSTINGKTATITWSVDREADKDYIAVSADGKKCEVTQSTLNPEVRLYATFSYNNKTQKTNYRMTVSFERERTEQIDYWYNNVGVSTSVSGYITGIATEYSTQYKNVSLYVVNDEYDAGYYLYRATLKNTDDASKIAIGAHVTFSGATNTSYGGLWETNAGGTLVFDEGKPAYDAAKALKALDNDLLANSPVAAYNVGRLVSLDKWTVTAKATVDATHPKPGVADKTVTTGALFTLKKGNVEVTVGVSKYIESAYKAADGDTTFKALCDLYDSINVDDVISVSGILSYYNGYQILPVKAADVVKETVAATDASAAALAVKAAIAAVQEVCADNGISYVYYDAPEKGNPSYKTNAGYMIIAGNDIEAPATIGDVSLKYEILHDSPSATYDKNNNKITLTVDKEDIATLKITYTVKNGETVVYETYTYHSAHVKQMTEEQVVSNMRFNLELKTTETSLDDIDLPTTNAQFKDSTITWAIKTEEGATPVAGVKISDKGDKLEVTPNSEADRTVVLVATLKYGEATGTKEIEIKIEKAVANVILTTDSLGVSYGEKGQYTAEGTEVTLNGVKFNWHGMGNYGDGLQMRYNNANTGTSSFWNTSAFETNITKLIFVWSDTKTLPTKTNVLKIEIAKTADFADAKEEIISFASKKVEVAVTGEYKYFRVTHNNNGAVYLASVSVVCA